MTISTRPVPGSRAGRRGRALKYLTAAAGTAVLLAASALQAQATLSGSTFEGHDGNMVVDAAGKHDWANVNPVTGVDLPTGKGDNSFGQGSKEDNANVTIVKGSIPPNKNDLQKFHVASEQNAATGDMFLYLGWERLVNIGNANLDFEINKRVTAGWTSESTGALTINRTAGDLLVSYDFGGSGTPTIGLNTWLTAENGDSAKACYEANALRAGAITATCRASLPRPRSTPSRSTTR